MTEAQVNAVSPFVESDLRVADYGEAVCLPGEKNPFYLDQNGKRVVCPIAYSSFPAWLTYDAALAMLTKIRTVAQTARDVRLVMVPKGSGGTPFDQGFFAEVFGAGTSLRIHLGKFAYENWRDPENALGSLYRDLAAINAL